MRYMYTIKIEMSVVMSKTRELNELLDAFVNLYSGMKQRDASWYKSMATTIGGSEIAALLSISEIEELRKYKSPYSNFNEIIQNKIAIVNGEDNWGAGGIACWWGTLFEEVITITVEIELGEKIKGDSICIQIIKGHRNSPDGYIVAHFCEDEPFDPANPKYKLYTTDMNNIELIKFSKIVMLEFKCPLSRKPTGDIPNHYVPQLWSGLAVSSVASLGVFVDSIFRKCAIGDLGENKNYDTTYHNKDHTLTIGDPICWGMIGIYSTIKPIAQFTDVGTSGYSDFHYIMGAISEKKMKTEICTPWFPKKRYMNGNQLCQKYDSPEDLINELKENTPTKYYFLGVLPWKLFYSAYIPINPRANFLEEIQPLIAKVHDTVTEMIQAQNK